MNLTIESPARMPDSLLLTPRASSGASSDNEVVHVEDIAEAPSSADEGENVKHSRASDSDAVSAADIAEYQAAVASNPDPFGFGSGHQP